MTHLFAYGTLQFAEIMAAVTGRSMCGTSAILDGYARFAIRNEPFPGIVPSQPNRVEGVLYTDVTPAEWRRIDIFEGALYHRETVRVRLPGTWIDAITYVIRPRWRTIMSTADWDPNEFAVHWHETYVERIANARRTGEPG